ncbi:unnamed protein product [Prorocentrum cordatum]|uniref:Uncharacterized protein n=1 Tax=Prorocentrum cordatum TaxID=2364126 RepID=A0ABN9W888_9DINO|nr:unnamed protein product [Polarella glacialis]
MVDPELHLHLNEGRTEWGERNLEARAGVCQDRDEDFVSGTNAAWLKAWKLNPRDPRGHDESRQPGAGSLEHLCYMAEAMGFVHAGAEEGAYLEDEGLSVDCAAQPAHCQGPLELAPRPWLALGGIKRLNAKPNRQRTVTPEMLTWLHKRLQTGALGGQARLTSKGADEVVIFIRGSKTAAALAVQGDAADSEARLAARAGVFSTEQFREGQCDADELFKQAVTDEYDGDGDKDNGERHLHESLFRRVLGGKYVHHCHRHPSTQRSRSTLLAPNEVGAVASGAAAGARGKLGAEGLGDPDAQWPSGVVIIRRKRRAAPQPRQLRQARAKPGRGLAGATLGLTEAAMPAGAASAALLPSFALGRQVGATAAGVPASLYQVSCSPGFQCISKVESFGQGHDGQFAGPPGSAEAAKMGRALKGAWEVGCPARGQMSGAGECKEPSGSSTSGMCFATGRYEVAASACEPGLCKCAKPVASDGEKSLKFKYADVNDGVELRTRREAGSWSQRTGAATAPNSVPVSTTARSARAASGTPALTEVSRRSAASQTCTRGRRAS